MAFRDSSTRGVRSKRSFDEYNSTANTRGSRESSSLYNTRNASIAGKSSRSLRRTCSASTRSSTLSSKASGTKSFENSPGNTNKDRRTRTIFESSGFAQTFAGLFLVSRSAPSSPSARPEAGPEKRKKKPAPTNALKNWDEKCPLPPGENIPEEANWGWYVETD